MLDQQLHLSIFANLNAINSFRFSTRSVVAQSVMRTGGRMLGLVIDLTNTDRYYDSADFVDEGIEYVKITCPGHEIDTRPDLVRQFHRVVEKFEKENQDNGGWKFKFFIIIILSLSSIRMTLLFCVFEFDHVACRSLDWSSLHARRQQNRLSGLSLSDSV